MNKNTAWAILPPAVHTSSQNAPSWVYAIDLYYKTLLDWALFLCCSNEAATTARIEQKYLDKPSVGLNMLQSYQIDVIFILKGIKKLWNPWTVVQSQNPSFLLMKNNLQRIIIKKRMNKMYTYLNASDYQTFIWLVLLSDKYNLNKYKKQFSDYYLVY